MKSIGESVQQYQRNLTKIEIGVQILHDIKKQN